MEGEKMQNSSGQVKRVLSRVEAVLLGVGALLVALLVATSCSAKQNEPLRDAGTGQRDESAADLVSFPDGFSNVATKCNNGNRIYVVFKGDENRAAIAVVPNDPTCSGSRR